MQQTIRPSWKFRTTLELILFSNSVFTAGEANT